MAMSVCALAGVCAGQRLWSMKSSGSASRSEGAPLPIDTPWCPARDARLASRIRGARASHEPFQLGSFEPRVICTPHSGYHFDRRSPWCDPRRRFFEGWYFRITLPEESLLPSPDGTPPPQDIAGDSLAWMYAIEDPGAKDGATRREEESGIGTVRLFPGVAAQVMGPKNSLILRKSDKTERFWASTYSLSLGFAFNFAGGDDACPRSTLPPQEFSSRVKEGFQVTATTHQGSLALDPKLSQAESLGDLGEVSWSYTTRAVHGWGGLDPASVLMPRSTTASQADVRRRLDEGAQAPQKATAGWMAALPVFEPHWQVCMAGGLSSGWVRVNGQTVHFRDAPSYAEKNWGASFPLKWFWVQCNAFEGFSGDLALTAGGGRRKVPWAGNEGSTEDVAMVGVHWQGMHFEFVPWKGEVAWKVRTWGLWEMAAASSDGLFRVVVRAETASGDGGVVLHAPVAEGGFQPMCKDSFGANLTMRIYQRTASTIRRDGDLWAWAAAADEVVLLDSSSSMCAVEVGGGPWWDAWEGRCTMGQTEAAIIGAPVNVRSLLGLALKPPGL